MMRNVLTCLHWNAHKFERALVLEKAWGHAVTVQSAIVQWCNISCNMAQCMEHAACCMPSTSLVAPEPLAVQTKRVT